MTRWRRRLQSGGLDAGAVRQTTEVAQDAGQVEAAYPGLTCGPGYASSQETTLISEMYAYADHKPDAAATVLLNQARSWPSGHASCKLELRGPTLFSASSSICYV